MKTDAGVGLAEQVRDLLAWADYIVDSLHWDRPHDPGRLQELRELLGESGLRDLRLQAWGLRERLDRARILSETARPFSATS
ncbi:MAG: hypothetical protein JO332_13270 [Planctomycetaceae bacterium]|nr:hypothetical protein [Planctomycetaceae bacterium]